MAPEQLAIRHASRTSAHEVMQLISDPGSYVSWDTLITYDTRSGPYRSESVAAAERAGTDESIVTGSAAIAGHRIALIINEFNYLGGSIGQDAANRIVSGIHRATREGLPLLASAATGGTRMQEGTPAFVRMIDICRAVMAHRAAGLPYLVHLRHPTTGGVFASWGSLGHLTVAEPGALIGFLGPKVYERLTHDVFPAGVQQAENLHSHRLIDAVVPTDELRTYLLHALTIFDRPSMMSRHDGGSAPTAPPAFSWASIEATRDPLRPGAAELLEHCLSPKIALRPGDDDNDAISVWFGRVCGIGCVVIAQDHAPSKRLRPASLRAARRAMSFAQELRLPLVTVIDTAGAEMSVVAEEDGLAIEIAHCIAEMTTLTVPTIAVLLGQGCGGGALALFPARHVIAATDAWLAPLAPEGASAIMNGHTNAAAHIAEQQRIDAGSLHELGHVHTLVPGPDARGPEPFIDAVRQALTQTLAQYTYRSDHTRAIEQGMDIRPPTEP